MEAIKSNPLNIIKDQIKTFVNSEENKKEFLKIPFNIKNINSDLRSNVREIGSWLAYSQEINGINYGLDYQGPIEVIDFFSGCGGISTGFKAAASIIPSYREKGAVDIDQVANKSYEANLGIKPETLDINDLAFMDIQSLKRIFNIEQKNPLVVIGCAPCQGFSAHSKKMKNDNDLRNTLVGTFAKVAVKLEPDFVVMENVPELLKKKYWENFIEFKSVMEEKGYIVRARIINMAEYGVPQARNRALVIASKKKFLMPKGFLLKENFRTVRNAIGYLPSIEPGEKNSLDPYHITANHRQSTIDTIASVPKDGGKRQKGTGPQCLDKVNGFSDVYGRLFWDRPAITITNYARNPASGRYSHPEQNRGLSIREASLLQGFPSNFIFEGNFDEKFRQIGNAVPPRFSAYLAMHLLGEILSEEPDDVTFKEDLIADIN